MNHKQTCATKEGRWKAALALREALEPYGCKVELVEGEGRRSREIGWTAAFGPYICFGYLDGTRSAGGFTAFWQASDRKGAAIFAPGFGVAAHVRINSRHRRKAIGSYGHVEDLIGFTRAGIIYLKTAAELTRSAGAHK